MASFSPFSPSRPSRLQDASAATRFGVARNPTTLTAPDSLAAHPELSGHLLTWQHTAPASGGAVRYEVETQVEAQDGGRHVSHVGVAGTLLQHTPEAGAGQRAAAGARVAYRVRAVQGHRRSAWSAQVVATVGGRRA